MPNNAGAGSSTILPLHNISTPKKRSTHQTSRSSSDHVASTSTGIDAPSNTQNTSKPTPVRTTTGSSSVNLDNNNTSSSDLPMPPAPESDLRDLDGLLWESELKDGAALSSVQYTQLRLNRFNPKNPIPLGTTLEGTLTQICHHVTTVLKMDPQAKTDEANYCLQLGQLAFLIANNICASCTDDEVGAAIQVVLPYLEALPSERPVEFRQQLNVLIKHTQAMQAVFTSCAIRMRMLLEEIKQGNTKLSRRLKTMNWNKWLNSCAIVASAIVKIAVAVIKLESPIVDSIVAVLDGGIGLHQNHTRHTLSSGLVASVDGQSTQDHAQRLDDILKQCSAAVGYVSVILEHLAFENVRAVNRKSRKTMESVITGFFAIYSVHEETAATIMFDGRLYSTLIARPT